MNENLVRLTSQFNLHVTPRSAHRHFAITLTQVEEPLIRDGLPKDRELDLGDLDNLFILTTEPQLALSGISQSGRPAKFSTHRIARTLPRDDVELLMSNILLLREAQQRHEREP